MNGLTKRTLQNEQKLKKKKIFPKQKEKKILSNKSYATPTPVLEILKHGMLWKIYESSHQRCSLRKVFLKIPQNSQENTYVRVIF